MIITLLVLLGLVLGSFVNAAVWRLHEQEAFDERPTKTKGHMTSKSFTRKREELSILTGRSMCTHCGRQLKARDLIPVVSYIWLRGKCRYCKKPIEDTPASEIAVPVLFLISFLWWPFGFNGWWSLGSVLFYFWLICIVGFVVLGMYDLRWFLLPDKVVWPLIVLAAMSVTLQAVIFHGGLPILIDALWGVITIAGTFWLLYTVSRGKWIGFGDVKLAVALGLLVGGPFNALLVIFIASMLGSLAALPLLAKGKAHAATPIPFGPFLMAATVIVMLFGAHIIGWYEYFLRLG